MNRRHQPDHEMQIMRRTLRELAILTPEGRNRVLAYLTARIDTLPPPPTCGFGEQQLDIEEAT